VPRIYLDVCCLNRPFDDQTQARIHLEAEGREWYKAMPFVCAALARHIYHCLKFNDPYDVEKAFQGATLQPASDEEWLDLGADLEEKFEVMETHLCQIEE
jgi:hypothetical protein